MRIEQRRIINIDHYLAEIPNGTEIRIVTDVTGLPAATLTRVGLSNNSANGTKILPSIVGPISRFNSEGKWLVHRDQPKESRYIRTVKWKWRQWIGRNQYEEHEDFRDVNRDCYPRELIDPPSIEFQVVTVANRKLIASPTIVATAANHEAIKHIINLHLEAFGVCDLITEDIHLYQPPQTQSVNWKLLPPGQYPWPQLRENIGQVLRRASDNTIAVIMDRAETIRGHGPSRIFVGQGGFNDYLAYEFASSGTVVLESIRRDNAIYVFGDNWQEVSQLSKAQVLSGNHHQDRIIHAGGWKDRLAEALA